MSKICPQCGLNCIDSAPFCSQCGCIFPQEGAPAQQSTGYPQQPTYPQQQTGYPQQQYTYPQQSYGYPQQQPYAPQDAGKSGRKGARGRGFAITSMILGIIGFLSSSYGLSSATQAGTVVDEAIVMMGDGAFFAVLALIFALIALGRKYKRQAIAGLILSIVALVTSAIGFMYMFVW